MNENQKAILVLVLISIVAGLAVYLGRKLATKPTVNIPQKPAGTRIAHGVGFIILLLLSIPLLAFMAFVIAWQTNSPEVGLTFMYVGIAGAIIGAWKAFQASNKR